MTTAEVAAVPLSDLDHRARLRRAVSASTVGTTINGTISSGLAKWPQ
jgi:hypothetical protein